MASNTINIDHTAQEAVPKLVRQTLAERIADELRNLVLLEKLQPGSAIPERETAEALGVSRTPLRESLRILAAEGLVEIAPNRPPLVANPSIDELKDLLRVQGALEALAGELACSEASESELKTIARLNDEMQRASASSDPLEFFQKDMLFHESIVKASGNQALIDTHKTYNARLWRARFISSRRRVNRAGTLKQHDEITEALLAKDASSSAVALRSHLETGARNIESVLSQEPLPSIDESTVSNVSG